MIWDKNARCRSNLHRAIGCGCPLSWFSFDTHVAQLVRIDVFDEQVCACKDEEQEQDDWHCNDEHRSTPFSLNTITILEQKSYTPYQYCNEKAIQLWKGWLSNVFQEIYFHDLYSIYILFRRNEKVVMNRSHSQLYLDVTCQCASLITLAKFLYSSSQKMVRKIDLRWFCALNGICRTLIKLKYS